MESRKTKDVLVEFVEQVKSRVLVRVPVEATEDAVLDMAERKFLKDTGAYCVGVVDRESYIVGR